MIALNRSVADRNHASSTAEAEDIRLYRDPSGHAFGSTEGGYGKASTLLLDPSFWTCCAASSPVDRPRRSVLIVGKTEEARERTAPNSRWTTSIGTRTCDGDS